MKLKNDRFPIILLTVGAASVLIGLSFLGFNSQNAKADTVDNASKDANETTNTTVGSVDDQTKLNVTTDSAASSAAQIATEKASAADSSAASSAETSEASSASNDAKVATFAVSDLANTNLSAKALTESKAATATTTKTTAETNGLNYPATEVHQGSNTIVSVSSNGKTPEGATYELATDFQTPEGVTVDVNSSTGQISVAATTAAQLASFNIPVTVTYPDQSQTPDTLTATVTVVEAYKNTANVTDWSSFISALEDANVDNINITHDITVTGKTGSLGGQSLGYNGCLTFKQENVARNVTITGNGNTVDFGHYSLMFQDANQKNGNGWDITIDNTTLKGVSEDGSGKTSATEPGQFGLISFADVSSDNQKNDKVTFNNVTANAEGRAVITGAGLNHSSEYYTLVLTGNNDITASEDLSFQGSSGSALDAGYVSIENGTTNINVTSAYDGSNNYGGNAIRTAQTDIHNDDGSTVYTFDIKKGATLNITGGANARGIFAVDGVHGTANIDGNVNMNLGTGHSMAVFAGNLNVGKDGVLDVTTAYDATPDWGQIGRSISNFNGGQYGVLSIGVGNPTNLTNVDTNTINDNGVIRVKVTSTNEGMNPIISMGSGSSAVLKGTFTINVNQGATLDLQSSRQQTNLGMIFVSGSSANSNINIVNPKYVNLQRLNTPLPSNGSDLIYLEGGGQSGRTNGVHISNSPIAEWQAANTSTAPNFTWMVQSVNSMNNWGTNAGSGFTVAGQTSPQNADGQEKFLYSNGSVIMAPSQSGTNSFEYNGSQTINKNSNQGIITQGSGSVDYYTPYLNQFLNNYSYWTPQRLAMGSQLLDADSPVPVKDNDLYDPEVQTINGNTSETLNDLNPEDGIKDLIKASMDDNGNWSKTTVPVDGNVQSVAWYTSADATDWANTMAGQDIPTNPEGNLKTTDTSAWAKVTYNDGSIDFVNIPLNITDKTNADLYTPSYQDTSVKRGSETTIPVTITDADGKTTTVPEGTKFEAGDFTAPEGVTVTVDPTSGEIKVTTKNNTPTGEFDIPVTVTYKDGSVDNTTAKVTVINNDADDYQPSYKPVNVDQGGTVQTGAPTYTTSDSKAATAPEGTTYTIPEGTKLPEGVTATVDPNTGNVTVTTSSNTPEGPIFVPVTVTYPDGSQETIDAPIAVGSNSFIGTDYSVTVETGLDNLHETTANSMYPAATDVISKITYWNNNDVRAGKNLAGTVVYDRANGIGNLDDVTAEWTTPINTNVDSASMSETLPGTGTSTVANENPAIKVTYGANSQLIKDTGSNIFSINGGSQTVRWYGNSVTVQGATPVADAASKSLVVSPAKAGDALTDAEKALLDLTNLDKLTANKPVSYTWVNDLKDGDTKGTVKITFSDKAANGQATYLNVELPAGSLNVGTEEATGKPIVTPQGKVPEASEGIGNVPDLPTGTTYTWKDGEPDVSKIGESPVTVTVHYPDGNTQDVPTTIIVTGTEKPTDPTSDDQKDLFKTVTRTIDGTTPDGKKVADPQTVVFARTKTVTAQDGKAVTTYGDYQVFENGAQTGKTTGSFTQVDVPQVDGYTSQVDGKDATVIPADNNVTAETTDVTVNVTYNIDSETQQYQFVDKTNGQNVGEPISVKGNFGEQVPVSLTIPNNYELAEGQTLPTETPKLGVTNPVIKIYLDHKTEDVTNDPSEDKNVNKTITRTIDLDIAGKTSEYKKQTVTLHRTATKDLVTGEVTYGAWNTEGAKFDAVTAPEEAGYTVSNPNAAPELAVTGDTQDSTVTFVYGADEHGQVINYVDKDGNVIKHYDVTGKTGETVDTNIQSNVPEGWVITDKTVPGQITFGSNNPDPINVNIEHGTKDITNDPSQADKVNKTITRTIDLDIAGKTSEYTKQSVTLHRTATEDLVTKEVTYGAWNTDGAKFDAVTAPEEAGYTVTNPDAAPEVAITGDTESSTVTFNYTADAQTRKINFVDPDGKTVGTQTLTGKTGTSVTIGNGDGETPLQVPAGYEIVPGTEIPTRVPFNADSKDNGDITVQVEAKKDTDDGRNDKGNKDVYREVTRTITVNIEGQASQTRTQTLAFYRIKTTNEATGEVSYTDWTSNMTDGSTSFPDFAIPTMGGYTRTITGGTITTKDGKDYVAAQSGLENGEPVNNITVTVNYTYSDQTATIKYVNNSDHNDVVGTQVVGGKTGETVPVTLQVPTNWKVVGGQNIPSSFTFGNTPIKDTIVYVEHGTKDVTNDPSQADKVNKTITRTIDLDIAGKTSVYTKQSVTIHRTATEDLVTGKVTYGAWNLEGAKFDKVEAPTEAGYTVNNPDAAPAMDVTGDTADSTVTFVYGANEHSEVINYVDNTGKTIKTYDVTGATGETVDPKIKANVPNGYHVVGEYPTSITFGSNDPAPITVHVEKDAPTYGENATGTPIVTEQGVEPDPADGIGNKGDLDPNTKYTWTNGEPDVSKIGKTTVSITVTYPDGKTQIVDTPLIVTGTEIPTNPNDPSQSDLFKTVTRTINGTTPDGKKVADPQTVVFARTKTVDKSGNTTYGEYQVFENGAQTGKTTGSFAQVAVPQVDGYTSQVDGKNATVIPADNNVTANTTDVTVNVTYTETDAHKYTPEGQDVHTSVGETPSADKGIANIPSLPTGTTYTWKDGDPDTKTPGTKDATVVVTYPDGSKDEVPVHVIVTTNPTDADKYTPVPKPVVTPEGKVPDAEEGIKNPTDLPTGTKYDWKNPDQVKHDVTVPGTHDATIVVTYPDGSKDEVTTTITVPTPEGQPVDTDKGVVPDPSKGIKNPQDMPDGTKYTWKDTPDVSTPGTKDATVVVTYPDGNKTEVPVTVIVTDNTPSTPVTPVTPSQPTDADTYTPEPKPINTDKGVMPNPEDGIKNPGDLPSGTKYEWTNGEPDVNTPGTRPVSITVTYPDGSTDIVTTTITVNEPAPVHPSVDGQDVDTNKGGNGNGNGETAPVHAATNNAVTTNHANFYRANTNRIANTKSGEKTLPQTGVEANMAGLLGLMIASVGAILGLAADKKRKN